MSNTTTHSTDIVDLTGRFLRYAKQGFAAAHRASGNDNSHVDLAAAEAEFKGFDYAEKLAGWSVCLARGFVTDLDFDSEGQNFGRLVYARSVR